MKVALVHDYLKEYGGAERVLEALHELYPKAPVFTTVYLPSYLGPHRERFRDWNIRTSWLQYIPFKQKLISPLRLLTPWVFKQFDFSDYDVVIVSATGAYFPNTIPTTPHPGPLPQGERGKRKVVHICYCHTPPRYLYGFATAREWKKNIFFRILGAVANHILRLVDFEASKNVDYYIANSEEVAGRIRKFYRRDSTVIYPPVDIASPMSSSRKRGSEILDQVENDEKGYFLAGGRLARPKHIDLIVRACLPDEASAKSGREPIRLKVFGKSFAGYGDELKSQIANRKSQIEFLGEVTDEEKWELMSGAKAYINASEDEDFGILPVEAMAAGTPVIAYRSGGVKETVVDGETGLFFDELTEESLKNAMKKLEKMEFNAKSCWKRAELFSKEQFMKQIEAFLISKA
ncbi:MAG: glycosyltransferase [Candidatus Levybacteria bacterium]|nr:glycosyltransferase [Candidatus Levybacteria bacterium]